LGALLAQDVILLRRQLRAPFRVGFFDLVFLGGLRRRGAQPAEGCKAKQAGDRCEQDAAVDHQGSPCGAANIKGSPSNTVRDNRSYTDPSRILSLSCEPASGVPSVSVSSGAGGCGRTGRGWPG